MKRSNRRSISQKRLRWEESGGKKEMDAWWEKWGEQCGRRMRSAERGGHAVSTSEECGESLSLCFLSFIFSSVSRRVGVAVSPFISSHPSCSLLLCLSSAGAVSFRLRLRVRTPAKCGQREFIQFWVIFWNTQWHSLELLAHRLLAVIHYLQNACKLRFH